MTTDDRIRGKTTIAEILRRYPDGRAAKLMFKLNWACALCGVATSEPLAMAAKKHKCSPLAVLEAFRALDEPEGPSEEQVARAAERHRNY
ncbi:MAG: hypothetical protein WBM90_14020 [Acidimicrobiia bacterium]